MFVHVGMHFPWKGKQEPLPFPRTNLSPAEAELSAYMQGTAPCSHRSPGVLQLRVLETGRKRLGNETLCQEHGCQDMEDFASVS